MRMGIVLCLQCAGFHSCSEWQKGKGARMGTIIVQCTFITGLRQWTTFSLWVGWAHLPPCCTAGAWWGTSHTLKRVVFGYTSVICPVRLCLSPGTWKCFLALDTKIILGLHLPPSLCTHHPAVLSHGPLVSKGGHGPCTPHSAASWPWLSHPATAVLLCQRGENISELLLWPGSCCWLMALPFLICAFIHKGQLNC